MTLSIKAEHNDAFITIYVDVTYAECHIKAPCNECRYCECHYAECRGAFSA
jgi:hypothetical protein